MSPLRTALTEYLALRRALGFKLQTTEITLRQFVHFVEREGALWITTDLALRWATQPQGVQPAHWATRLGMVRGLAQYCLTGCSHTAIDGSPPTFIVSRRSPTC
jgi:integrase/recombinase XerD